MYCDLAICMYFVLVGVGMILLILNRSFVFGLHNPNNMHVLCLAKYLLIESCWKLHYNSVLDHVLHFLFLYCF